MTFPTTAGVSLNAATVSTNATTKTATVNGTTLTSTTVLRDHSAMLAVSGAGAASATGAPPVLVLQLQVSPDGSHWATVDTLTTATNGSYLLRAQGVAAFSVRTTATVLEPNGSFTVTDSIASV